MSYLAILKSGLPYHLLAYSIVLGATTYQSFYSGIVAFRCLDYKNFSTLQAHVFPNYFRFQAVASLVLLALPAFGRDRVSTISLGVAAVGSLINALYLGPVNHDLSVQRIKQIEIEGKSHKDPTASEEMKAINRQFGRAHGQSVLTNMAVFLSLLNYGVWIASKIRR